MAATLVEDQFDDIDETEQQTTQQTVAQTTPSQDGLDGEDVPEKLRGKSVRDLLAILRDQEQHIGRQANEVGTLRRLVDQALEIKAPGHASRTAREEPPQEEQLDADRLLNDPLGSVSRVAKATTKPLEDRLEQLEAERRHQAFLRDHPTALNDVNDAGFVEWVKGNKARAKLGMRAFPQGQTPDFEAADDLWTLWEEHKAAKAQTSQAVEDEDPAPTPSKPAPKAQAAPKLLGGAGGQDPGTGKSQRILNRSKLIKMQAEHPESYYDEAFQAELMRAYREGRVK